MISQTGRRGAARARLTGHPKLGVALLTGLMQHGKAVQGIIEEYPDNRRVAVLGSGGLWHTPDAKDAYLDEEFDQAMLRYIEAGDACGMAGRFDAYQIPVGAGFAYRPEV